MADKDKPCGGCGSGCGGDCGNCGGNCKCRQAKRISELRKLLYIGRVFLRAAKDLNLSDEELMKILVLDVEQLAKFKKDARERNACFSDDLLIRMDCINCINRGLRLFYNGNLSKCNEWLRKRWKFLNFTPLEVICFNFDGLEVVTAYVTILR